MRFIHQVLKELDFVFPYMDDNLIASEDKSLTKKTYAESYNV